MKRVVHAGASKEERIGKRMSSTSRSTIPPCVYIPRGNNPVRISLPSNGAFRANALNLFPTFTLTISGNGFQLGAFVNFGAAVLVPTVITGNTVSVQIPAFLVRTSGIIPVRVTNADATGTSNRLFF